MTSIISTSRNCPPNLITAIAALGRRDSVTRAGLNRLRCLGAVPRLCKGPTARRRAGWRVAEPTADPQLASVVRSAMQLRPGDLVGALQAIQAHCGYLPKPALAQLAAETGRTLAQLYGVISFYATFSLERRGRVVVRVCTGTACHVRGAARVTDALVQHLAIEPGSTTEDFEFTLETVACLGCCSLAPVVTVAGHTHGRVDGPHAVAALAQVFDNAEELP